MTGITARSLDRAERGGIIRGPFSGSCARRGGRTDCGVFLALNALAPPTASAAGPPPRATQVPSLVVIVVVDGLSWERLSVYRPPPNAIGSSLSNDNGDVNRR